MTADQEHLEKTLSPKVVRRRGKYAVDMATMDTKSATKNERVIHPYMGMEAFAEMPEVEFEGICFPSAPIYLLNGIQFPVSQNGSGYGVQHIWSRHSEELLPLGYHAIGDVPRYVADILCSGARIHPVKDTKTKNKLSVVQIEFTNQNAYDRGPNNIVIVGFKGRLERAEGHYHVITAYPGKAEGHHIGVLP